MKMRTENIVDICKITRKYANTIGGVDINAELIEICDFGDSYGFLFEVEDKYANLYWCVDKKSCEPYTFRPNMNMDKYLNRKILPNSVVR